MAANWSQPIFLSRKIRRSIRRIKEHETSKTLHLINNMLIRMPRSEDYEPQVEGFLGSLPSFPLKYHIQSMPGEDYSWKRPADFGWINRLRPSICPTDSKTIQLNNQQTIKLGGWQYGCLYGNKNIWLAVRLGIYPESPITSLPLSHTPSNPKRW